MHWTPSYTNRWGTPKYQALSPLATYLYEYLQSNLATNFSGIYPLSISRVAIETKLSEDEVRRYITECSTVHLRVGNPEATPFIKYNKGVVWIVGQWEHGHCKNHNYKMAVANEFLRCPNLPFWGPFFTQYPEISTALTGKRSRYGRKDEFEAKLTALNSRNSIHSKSKSINTHIDTHINTPMDTHIDRGISSEQNRLDIGGGGAGPPRPAPPPPEIAWNSERADRPAGDGPAVGKAAAAAGLRLGNLPRTPNAPPSTAAQLAAQQFGWGDIPDDEKITTDHTESDSAETSDQEFWDRMDKEIPKITKATLKHIPDPDESPPESDGLDELLVEGNEKP